VINQEDSTSGASINNM